MVFNLQEQVSKEIEADSNCSAAKLNVKFRKMGWGGGVTKVKEAIAERKELNRILSSKTEVEPKPVAVSSAESAERMARRLLAEGVETPGILRQRLRDTGRFKESTVQQTVSKVRSEWRRGRVTAVSAGELGNLLEVKQLADRVGGLSQLRRMAEVIEKLRG